MLSVDKVAMPVRKDIGPSFPFVAGTALTAIIKMKMTTHIKVAKIVWLENTQTKRNKAVAKIAKVVTTIHKRNNENVRPAHLDGTKTKVASCHARTVRVLDPHIKLRARKWMTVFVHWANIVLLPPTNASIAPLVSILMKLG